MPESAFPCPCCGFLAFSEPPGSYEICPVCNWEDDHVQLDSPQMRGGANSTSLVEAQVAALRSQPLHLQRLRDLDRDPTWRPLTPADSIETVTPTSGSEYFIAAATAEPGYYWRRSGAAFYLLSEASGRLGALQNLRFESSPADAALVRANLLDPSIPAELEAQFTECFDVINENSFGVLERLQLDLDRTQGFRIAHLSSGTAFPIHHILAASDGFFEAFLEPAAASTLASLGLHRPG